MSARFLPLALLVASVEMCGAGCGEKKEKAGTGGPLISMSAEEITREFVNLDSLSDEAKPVLKKYEDRDFEVSGEVEVAEMLGGGVKWSVHLKGVIKPEAKRPKDGSRIYQIVDCQFAPDSPAFEKAKLVKPGQKVRIRGKFYFAFDYGVRLVECRSLEVE